MLLALKGRHMHRLLNHCKSRVYHSLFDFYSPLFYLSYLRFLVLQLVSYIKHSLMLHYAKEGVTFENYSPSSGVA